MIDKGWFALEGFEIIQELQEYDSFQLTIRSATREYDLIINECADHTIQTDIFLFESQVHLCSFASNRPKTSPEPIPVDKIRAIFTQWLVDQIKVEALQAAYDEIEVLAIYPYYLQGEKGLIEYKWKDLENRLNQDSRQQHKGGELLHLVRASEKLEGLVPYISLSRLCLGTEDENGYPVLDFCCFYYHNEEHKYVVSNYENTHKHYFATAKEAIRFAEERVDEFKKE